MGKAEKSIRSGILRTPEEGEKEGGDTQQTSISGSRWTRSQAAPQWSAKDSLILVNEIFSVEVDYQNELSSYQRWSIIAENCTALKVARTASQCRRRWDSLLSDYNKIKQWESQLNSEPYWSLVSARRKELGLPETFDKELFGAIDALVRAQEDTADTDIDTDSEAGADELDAIASGRKRQPCELMDQKQLLEERGKGNTGELPEEDRLIASRLRENAEMINSIIEGAMTDGVDRASAFETDQVRRGADKLIACFRVLVDSLDQLRELDPTLS